MMEIEALPSSSKLSPIGNIYRSTYQRANVKAMPSSSCSTSTSHDSKNQQQAVSLPHKDKVAASKLPGKMHRSFSLDPLSSDRKDEDLSTRTIEFLRARLLAERSTAKSAKQKAEELEKKVLELERTLQSEIEKRRNAEAALQESLETMLDSSSSSSSKSRSSINTESELECLSRAALSEDGQTRYSNDDFNTPVSSRRYDSQLEDDLLALEEEESDGKAEREEQEEEESDGKAEREEQEEEESNGKAEREEQEENKPEDEKEEDNKPEDEKEEDNKPKDEKKTQPGDIAKEDHAGESITSSGLASTSRQAVAEEHAHSLCQVTEENATESVSSVVELCTTGPSTPPKQSDNHAGLDENVGKVDGTTVVTPAKKRDAMGTLAEHDLDLCNGLSIEHADVVEPHLHSDSDWASEDAKDYRYRNATTGDNRSISSSSVIIKDWDSRSEDLTSDSSEDDGHKERTLLTSRLHLTQVDHVRKIGRSSFQTIKRRSSEKISAQTEIEEEQVLSELSGWVNHVVNMLEKGSASDQPCRDSDKQKVEASNCSVHQSQERNTEIQLQGNSSAATEHPTSGPESERNTPVESDKSSSITGKSINDSTQRKSYEPGTPTDSADSRSDKVEAAPYVSFAKYLGLTNLERFIEVQTDKHGTIWRIKSIGEGSTEQAFKDLISSAHHACKGTSRQGDTKSSGKIQAKEKGSCVQSAISFKIPIQNGEKKEAEGGAYRHQLNLQLDIGIKSMAQDRDTEHQVQGNDTPSAVQSSLRRKNQCSKGYDVAVSGSGDFICMDISYNGASSKQLVAKDSDVCKAREAEQQKAEADPSRTSERSRVHRDSLHVNKCHRKLLDKLQEFGCFQKDDTVNRLSPEPDKNVERRELALISNPENAAPKSGDGAVVDSKMEEIFKALKAAKQQLRSSIERRQVIEKQLLTVNP